MTYQEVFGLKVAHAALKGRVDNAPSTSKPLVMGGAAYLPHPMSEQGFDAIWGDLARHFGAAGNTPAELLQSLEQLHPQLKGV